MKKYFIRKVLEYNGFVEIQSNLWKKDNINIWKRGQWELFIDYIPKLNSYGLKIITDYLIENNYLKMPPNPTGSLEGFLCENGFERKGDKFFKGDIILQRRSGYFQIRNNFIHKNNIKKYLVDNFPDIIYC